MNTIRTILVDDHATFRQAFQKLVQTIGGIEVVGEAADGQQAADLTIKLRPQLVLMDICMPQMSGANSCCEMKRVNAALSVVLYSADSLEVEMAFEQGLADFCLNKECLFDELPAWICETFLSPNDAFAPSNE